MMNLHTLRLFTIVVGLFSVCVFLALAMRKRTRRDSVPGLIGTLLLVSGTVYAEFVEINTLSVLLNMAGVLLIFLGSLVLAKRRYA